MLLFVGCLLNRGYVFVCHRAFIIFFSTEALRQTYLLFYENRFFVLYMYIKIVEVSAGFFYLMLPFDGVKD